MKQLVKKYAHKMINAGLSVNPLICGLDDEVVWNRPGGAIDTLQAVMDGMNINSLICAQPAEPYRTILKYLVRRYPEVMTPDDCETRTFLHDLPVVHAFTADAILSRLMKRKSVLVNHENKVHVVTFGTVSPEQAFVTFSSVCFAGFVLFFCDYLADLKAGRTAEDQDKVFTQAVHHLDKPRVKPPKLCRGPFNCESQVYEALIQAGHYTVNYGLVDSYFGNISYRLDDTIYISQTGSSLDTLAGCIDPCPMDGSSCAGITASSELSAHTDIYLRTGMRAILHGHPRFTVILSMDCDFEDCPNAGRCHIACSQDRFIEDIPVVPGEVGTGPTGLSNTLPPAIKDRRGAIVWGHGLFTASADDFNQAFQNLLDIENMSRELYFRRVAQFRS